MTQLAVTPPPATDLLTAWEVGRRASTVQRSVLLLGALLPQLDGDALLGLTLGDRDERLLTVHRQLFGPALECVVRCPACAADLELELAVDALLAGGGGDDDAPEARTVEAGAWRVAVRALTLRDNDGIAIRRQWAEIWAAVAAGRKDPLTAAAAISKDLLAEHLQWVQQWLGEQLRELLLQAAPQRRCEALAHMQQDVVDAQRHAAGNAQAQLLMESLFVRWLRLSRAAAQTSAATR